MSDIITTVNAIRDAVIAIEKELGINPKKIYANLRARLDILENRINNPSTSTPSVDNPFFVGSSGVTISAGTGEPVSSETAGSLYLRTDGEKYDGIYQIRGTEWIPISNFYLTYKLSGEETAGALIDLRLNSGDRLSFEDNKSFFIKLKILVVGTTAPTKRAYFEYDILSYKESGTFNIDSINQSLSIDNGTGYTFTISVISNELSIIIDAVGSDDRIATCIAEVHML